MPAITPNLWFDGQAEEAAAFYCSVFPNSKITSTVPYGEANPYGETGKTMLVEFELDGQPYTGINGGPQFPFTEAVSFLITCADQEEADRYWERLTADGGEEVQCGWLRDRYGLSWQVFPVEAGELLADPDPERRERATNAMLGQIKIDVEELRRAADGVTAADAGR